MEEKIKALIADYVARYPAIKGTLTKWQDPLVAFAAADDSLFPELKQTVSPTHALPTDFVASARTVIAFFLPFSKDVAVSNVAPKEASREWVVAYIETNRLILDINNYVHERLKELGYNTSILPATHNFDEKKLISDWSHRHVAFIAGLGTFGINNMLITEKGCCGRFGSIVTDLKLQPTARPKQESCLYKLRGICKKCVERCESKALTAEGYDRHRCYEVLLQNVAKYTDLGLADVCGKCLVNLPCSFINPGRCLA